MTLNIIETLLILIINASSVSLLIIVLGNSAQTKLNRWFAVITILITGWVDFSYLGISVNDISQSLFFYRINLAFVSAFIFSFYVFLMESILNIERRKFKLLLLAGSIVFIILSLFTDTIVQDSIVREWGNELVPGELNSILSVLSAVVACILVYHFTKSYIAFSKNRKAEIKYFFIGTLLFVLFNIIFNVLAPLFFDTSVYQNYGDYSASIFLAFTGFAMLKHRFLDVKVALTATLISIVGILLIVDIVIISNSLVEQGIKVLILIFFIIVSILLVRSVLNETKQREELQKAYKQVQGLRQHEQDMIDIMGHELRTPITIVRNSLGVMEMEFKKNGTIPQDKLARYIDIAMESARREVRLVETLLSSAKADSRGFQLMFEKVDVMDVVHDSMELFKKEGAKKGLEVVFNTTGEFLAYADRVRTQEIVDNLLSNAVKYTDKGKIEVALSKDSENIIIEVSDTGIGMTPEDIKRLGKKFYRVDQYISKDNEIPTETKQVIRPGGTGLGLYVTFSLTKIMDGSYKVESEVGKGSKFIIKLPIFNGQLNRQEQRKVEDDEVE